MDPDSFAALAATPVLAGMKMPALELIAAEGVLASFDAGAFIVREGEPGHSFFILVEGDVQVEKTNTFGHVVPLAVLKARTFLGEMCVVDPVPRAASVRALTIEIRAGTLYRLFQKMPDQYSIMLLNLARDMARRLRTLDEAFAAKAG
jgi:CRP/FNR family cyclic AMP-dependent transcriptional regulator